MKAPSFVYRRPNEIEEVLSLLADYEGRAQVLAGGQSLMPALNMRLASPEMLVDINRIEALRGIEAQGGAIRFGATVRHVEVMASGLVARQLPLLATAIPHVGHLAVRNRGTIGGSIALADPSAEMPAIAVALNASIVLRKRGTERTIAARDFFQGLYQTARQEDELITEIVFPASTADAIFGFSELSRRRGDFATVGVIACGQKSVNGGLHALNVVIFGSEAAPLWVSSASRFALQTNLSDAALADIAGGITRDMDPISNHQGRADTKRKQATVLLKRILKDMLQRTRHD